MTAAFQSAGCDCGLVDAHTHWVPHQFPAYVGQRKSVAWPSMAPGDAACDRNVMLEGRIYRTVPDSSWDAGRRLQEMTPTGVTHQVVSPMPELLSYWLAADDALSLNSFMNEELAAMVRADPAHFTGLGAVPLQDVELAIGELERCMKLGLAGVELGSNINGKPLGHADHEPFFAAAQSLGAAIFVHALRPAGMDRLVGPPLLEQVLAFPGDVGQAAASLLTSGTLARLPKLRIAFSHGGGSLAMLLEWGSFGANIDLEVLPTPIGVPLARWCNCVPCFGFLLTSDPKTTESCIEVFLEAGLAAARVGAIDTTGVITVTAGSESRVALDLHATTVTGLTRSS